MTDVLPPAQTLAQRRVEVRERIAGLERGVAEIVSATAAANTDDEHDPEGATIAFEREQLSALLAGARRQLTEIDAAIRRLEDGTYGRCESCGRPIGSARLAARPSASECIDCAGRR